jgi:hypothetical protein
MLLISKTTSYAGFEWSETAGYLKEYFGTDNVDQILQDYGVKDSKRFQKIQGCNGHSAEKRCNIWMA